MRLTMIACTLAAVAPWLVAAPAAAEDLGGGFSVSGGATVVSDYRFRGISQTDKNPAIQGTIGIAHQSGLYASVWGSSIDDYVAAGSDQEVDLVVGYKHGFGDTTIDFGLLYYWYPGSGGANTDFAEPYVAVSHQFGPVSAKATAAYAPSQSALTIGAGDEDNLYLAGDLSGALPGTPLTLAAHFGHSFGPSYLTIGDEYSDWSLGASYALKNLTLGVSYVDTDGTFITPSGRNASKAGVVASLGVSF